MPWVAVISATVATIAAAEQSRQYRATQEAFAPFLGDAPQKRDHSIEAAVKAHKQKMAEVEAETTRINRWLLWGMTAAILWGGYCIAQLAGIA